MKPASYLEVTTASPDCTHCITVNVKLVLDSPRKVLAFAFDMARSVSVAAWWHRVAVFFGLLLWGAHHMVTRSSS